MKKIKIPTFIQNILFLVIVTLLCVTIGGCTQNQRAKNYGGSATIEVPNGYKYTGTFDFDTNDDLWLDVIEVSSGKHYIMEFSSYGIFEGKFEIIDGTNKTLE